MKSLFPQEYRSDSVSNCIEKNLSKYERFKYIKYDMGKLLDYEMECLNMFNIPYYYCDVKTTHVLTSSGKVIGELRKAPFHTWTGYIVRWQAELKHNIYLINNIISSS